jgi:hypothetical protein
MPNYIATQFGILVAFLLVCICLSYLAHKGWSVYYHRNRFSLKDLFVALTLVASLIGLLTGIARDKEGHRDWRFRNKGEEWQRVKSAQE